MGTKPIKASIVKSARSPGRKESSFALDSGSLLSQLKDLLSRGEVENCHKQIQSMIHQDHPLVHQPFFYLVQAQVSLELFESIDETIALLKKAGSNPDPRIRRKLLAWNTLIHAIFALKEGDYQKGEKALEILMNEESVASVAKYKLAYHLFWKNIDEKRSCQMFEQICEQRPGLVKAWSCLGFIYNKMGLKEKSQRAFVHCLQRESNPKRREFFKQQLVS